MRILHLLAATSWGGAERMGCTHHQLTLAHGHESRIDAPGLAEVVAGLRDTLGTELGNSREASHLRWALGARARRKAYRPDVVHAHLATPGLAGAALWIAGATPLVLTFQLLPGSERWPRDYLLRLPSPFVLRRLRHGRSSLIALSEADRAQLARRFPGARVVIAPNLPSPPPSAAADPVQLAYPAGAVRLLSVGRLVAQKGFDLMLSVLAQPALRELPWHWLIVGDGAERAELEQRVAAAGLSERVRLLGALASHGLYEQADLVLCPSRYEGAPLVPREALRAGVPVLLSDIASHRELLAGAAAQLLPARAEEWAEPVATYLRSAEAREQLLRLQAPAARDQSEVLWSICAGVYQQLTLARSSG